MINKIATLLLIISPMTAMAYWEGDAIQTGPVQVDQWVDDNSGQVTQCRMIIGSRGESQKPVIAIFGNKDKGIDNLTIKATVNNKESEFFLFNIDHKKNHTGGKLNTGRAVKATMDRSVLDELATAKDSIFVEVAPLAVNNKPSSYNYRVRSHGVIYKTSSVKADVDEFYDCMGVK